MYAPTSTKEKLSFLKALAMVAAFLFLVLFVAGGFIRAALWVFDAVVSLFS